MAVTWNIVALDATKTVGSLSNVVTTIHWTAEENETVGSGESAVEIGGSANGSVSLAEPDSESFTAYDSITQENALSWLKAALGSDTVSKIEAEIARQITVAKTPTTTSGVPW